jgi:hypothetical protein
LLSDFDNAFATFLAPPPPACKKAAEKIECRDKLAKKKRKTMAASSFDSYGEDMAYTQSALTVAKGLKEPLVSSLDTLKCENLLPIQCILPGNTPKQFNSDNNVCIQ